MAWREIGHEEAGHFRVSDLKICELCGTLNLEVNEECFVCRWHGEFNRRPEVVKIAAEVTERRCGSLRLDNLTGPFVHRRSRKPKPLTRLRMLFSNIWHWLFG